MRVQRRRGDAVADSDLRPTEPLHLTREELAVVRDMIVSQGIPQRDSAQGQLYVKVVATERRLEENERERYLEVLMRRAIADPAGPEAAAYHAQAGESAEETWQRSAARRPLEHEMRSYFESMTRPEIELAEKLGVARADILGGLLGVARVRRGEDGLWEPHENGVCMYVTPVRVSPDPHNPFEPDSAVPKVDIRVGEIIDIVAWRPSRPDRWLLRTGDAIAMGTMSHRQSDVGVEPVAIREGPLDWLRHRGEGIVLLTSDREEQRLVLMAAERITVEKRELRERIGSLVDSRRTTIVEAPREAPRPELGGNVVALRQRQQQGRS